MSGSGNGGLDSVARHAASPPPTRPRLFPRDIESIPMSPSRLDGPLFRERVDTLMQQGDFYAKRLDLERRRARELDLQLARIRDVHLDTKKRLCAMTNAQLCSATTDVKNVRTLENRLDKILVRFSEMRNANKKLRDAIQSLRRDKLQQQAIQERLDRETRQQQTEMERVVSETQSSFDARDRAHRESEALRGQVSDDLAEFEQGWLERKEQLDQDRESIRDIPRLRTPRVPTRVAALAPTSKDPRSTAMTSMGTSGAGAGLGSPAGFALLSTPDLQLRSETLKNVHLLSEKEDDLRRQRESLQLVEDALAKIKKKTGVSDADELAQALLTAEEHNFSLFNLINAMNTEMEALEIENNGLDEQVALCQGSGAQGDTQRVQAQRALQVQIDKAKQKAEHLEQWQASVADAMDVLKTGIMAIYHKVGGPTDEAFAQQLASRGVTDANLQALLGVIEQRIGELVDMHLLTTNSPPSTAAATASDAMGSLTGTSADAAEAWSPSAHRKPPLNGASGGSAPLRPHPPSAEDFDMDDVDESEDGVHPCKIAELQENTAAVLTRRKDKATKAVKK